MKTSAGRKLAALVGVILLMGASVAFLTTKLQRESAQLQTRIEQMESDGFRTAEQFAELLRQLNESLYQYGRSRVAPNKQEFAATSYALDHWIELQRPKLTSQREIAILAEIDGAYHEYLRTAERLLSRLEDIGQGSASIDEYSELREQTHRLFALRKNLAYAHLASRKGLLDKAGAGLARIRLLTLISLALLFAFAVILSAVVYRDMIQPLRLKLIESEALRERQEKLASLGVLAAGVAHEIRNPLTAIKGALFMQQKHIDRDTQAFSETKVVEREILRLERIVNNFLLFARPRETKLVPMEAEAPLRAVHDLMGPPLAKNGVELVVEPVPSLRIQADEDQLKEVLINLIRNASEACEPGGRIRLRARADSKRLNQKLRSVVVLEVVDNGKGIPPSVQKRLFDPFFTTKDSGTGLGLSIAARIVQSHGGLLEYQTAPGHGTTFGIVLPAGCG